jgi:hypothetical protein
VVQLAYVWFLIDIPFKENIRFGYFKVEFLGEYESIFKKAWARGSVSQQELFDEKARGRKSRDTAPLSHIK